MTNQFKKGQKVWVVLHNYEVTEFEIGDPTDYCFIGVSNPDSPITAISVTTPMFPTKQECIDYIINSIKVIPYD